MEGYAKSVHLNFVQVVDVKYLRKSNGLDISTEEDMSQFFETFDSVCFELGSLERCIFWKS